MMKGHEQFADELAPYVLGELTGNDLRELEEHLQTCAACRRELPALRGDLGLLALSSGEPNPPARARERLMRAVAAEPRIETAPSPPELPRRSLWWACVPTLAAVALLLVVVGLWRNTGRLKGEIAELGNRYQDASLQLAQAQRKLHLLTAPDAVHVLLSPQSASKHPSGTAIFSPSQKRMLFMASNMAPPPPGKAYELWIIPVMGAPIPAGVFKPDEHGNAMMMDHPMPSGIEAKAFAVTMEEEAGSETPTMPILIMGQGE